MTYYRFISNGKGVYEQVDIDCPKDSALREDKPDGSWLAKVGPDYPGAISFFTEEGLKKYSESGLKDWHASAVKEAVHMVIGVNPTNILYEDKDQIILMEKDIELHS